MSAETVVRAYITELFGSEAVEGAKFAPISSIGRMDGDLFIVTLGPSAARRKIFVKRRGPGVHQAARIPLEAEALRLVQPLLGGPLLGGSVPELLGFHEEENILVAGFLPGAPMTKRCYLSAVTGFGRAGTRRRLHQIADWLAAFQSVAIDGETDLSDTRRDALDQLKSIDGLEEADRAWLAELAERLGEGKSRVPSVRMHGDFTLRNVLLRHGGIGVIDWERSTPGHVLTDPIRFASNIGLSVRKGAPAGRVASLCSEFLRRWLSGVPLEGFDRAALMGAASAAQIEHMVWLRSGLADEQQARTVFRALVENLRNLESDLDGGAMQKAKL